MIRKLGVLRVTLEIKDFLPSEIQSFVPVCLTQSLQSQDKLLKTRRKALRYEKKPKSFKILSVS